MGEQALEATQHLWRYLLAEQVQDPRTACRAHRRALALLGPDELPRAIKSQLETVERLGLARAYQQLA